jgi:hypothetical protein
MQKPLQFSLLFFLLGSLALFGSPVGSISGTVKDQSGGVIPSVQLTLTSSATNQVVKTTSNAA